MHGAGLGAGEAVLVQQTMHWGNLFPDWGPK